MLRFREGFHLSPLGIVIAHVDFGNNKKHRGGIGGMCVAVGLRQCACTRD